MKFLTLILLFTTVGSNSATAADLTDVSFRNNDNYYVSAALGFFDSGSHYINDGDSSVARANPVSGIIAAGADFEYMLDYDLGLAGLIRYYSTSEDIDDGEKLTYTVFNLGGEVRLHFPYKSWDFTFAPGFGFTSASAKYDDEKSEAGLTITPSLAIAGMFAVSDKIAVGVENRRIWGLGQKMNGVVINDYMLKGRYAF